ncbi:MAG TPA: DUF3159 domain-containing protein [Kofleriaceae bacterium]
MKIADVIATSAPAVGFVGVTLVSSLHASLVAAGLVAIGILGWRAARHQTLKQPLFGIAIVAVGAVVVSLTGEARGFFLVPALVPFVVTAVCAVTLAVRRPLTGLLLNRLCGGPPDWPQHPALLRVYSLTTIACLVVDAVNAAIQFVFYRRSDTIVLAVAHVGTGPVFAAIVAATITFARRAIQRKSS